MNNVAISTACIINCSGLVVRMYFTLMEKKQALKQHWDICSLINWSLDQFIMRCCDFIITRGLCHEPSPVYIARYARCHAPNTTFKNGCNLLSPGFGPLEPVSAETWRTGAQSGSGCGAALEPARWKRRMLEQKSLKTNRNSLHWPCSPLWVWKATYRTSSG